MELSQKKTNVSFNKTKRFLKFNQNNSQDLSLRKILLQRSLFWEWKFAEYEENVVFYFIKSVSTGREEERVKTKSP